MKYSTNIKNVEIYPPVVKGHRQHVSRFTSDNATTGFGVNAKYYIQPYFAKSFITPPVPTEYEMIGFKSGSFNLGLRYKRNITKTYSIGLNAEWGSSKVNLKNFTNWDSIIEVEDYKAKESFTVGSINVELYQRIRLLPATSTGLGLFWDTGIFGQWIAGASHNMEVETDNVLIDNSILFHDFNKFQYGIRTRIGYGMISIYGQYRLSEFVLDSQYPMPKLEAGIELSIPMGL
jgi:hypothetical protein